MRIDRVKFAMAQAAADLTVSEIAEMSGLSRGTVTAVKNGKSCSQETANKLIAVLGKCIVEEGVAK